MRASRIFLGPTPTFDQAAFRFGKDDGSESAHTWHAAQDVNVELPISETSILRMQTNSGGDQPTQQFKIQVKRTSGPESEWRDIPIE